MSKNSAKQRVTQLMEWLPTLKSKRSRPVKARDTRQRTDEGFKSKPSILSNDFRIKNGPSGRR
jgi:hypothetical protein